MRRMAGIVALLTVLGCARDHLPTGASGVTSATLGYPKNTGTQVWLVPVPAGDVLRMAREPELWSRARARIDVFSFYQLQAYDVPGFECGTPCGPNTYQAFRDVIPRGMFRWLNDEGILIGLETASVKDYACTPESMVGMADGAIVAIQNIRVTGASVAYVSLDEPFFSGTNPVDAPGFGGCALSLAQTASLVRDYIAVVHAAVPEVRIGLIEPYPALSADEILAGMLELERLGVVVPFFHVDVQLRGVSNDHLDVARDLRRLREFCRARGIPFGIIITGTDGTSNEGFAAGAWAMARTVQASVGVTEHTVFQSWAESEFGNLVSRKYIPDTVPENDPSTHTGQVLGMLEYLGVRER